MEQAAFAFLQQVYDNWLGSTPSYSIAASIWLSKLKFSQPIWSLWLRIDWSEEMRGEKVSERDYGCGICLEPCAREWFCSTIVMKRASITSSLPCLVYTDIALS